MMLEELTKQREVLERRSERQCAEAAASAQERLELLLEKGGGEVLLERGGGNGEDGEDGEDVAAAAARGCSGEGFVGVKGFVGDLGPSFAACMSEYDASAEGPARERVLLGLLTGGGVKNGAGINGAGINGAGSNGAGSNGAGSNGVGEHASSSDGGGGGGGCGGCCCTSDIGSGMGAAATGVGGTSSSVSASRESIGTWCRINSGCNAGVVFTCGLSP
jgi:hypothetical protein